MDSGIVFRLDSRGRFLTVSPLDSAGSFSGLTLDRDGSLYGTSAGGFDGRSGTIFRVGPGDDYSSLYEIQPSEGIRPMSGVQRGFASSFHGTTANGGEGGLGTIFQFDPGGSLTTIHSFHGDDGAYPAAPLIQDGDGRWYGIAWMGGHGYGVIFRFGDGPGGRRLPGDCNSDGELDLSDAVCLLGFLFLGEPQELPCAYGKPGDTANVRLLDHNGDGAIDLSDAVSVLRYLFLGGDPPHAGRECREVLGCSPRCP